MRKRKKDLAIAEPFQYISSMRSQWSVLIALFGVAAVTLPACSQEANLEENNIMPVDNAKNSRAMFDKYEGNYDAMSEADRNTYLGYHDNDETRAKATWDAMATGGNRL